MPQTGPQPAVKVTLDAIYQQGQDTAAKVTDLEHAVSRMVAINRRLDKQRADLGEHEVRLRKLEVQVASQWVIVGLITAAISAVLIKVITG